MERMQRFWELDFLRGVAIIMMIAFHVFFDLNYFGVYRTNLHTGFWFYFARLTAAIFILLVGICLTISCSRGRKFNHFLFRGLKIFSFGLIITAMTWLFLPRGFIIFGILHFIGLSVLLAYPFLKYCIKYRILNLLLGAAAIAAGLYLQTSTFNFSWLLWLGFTPQNFYTVDYFPLLPWFGLVLMGIFAGNMLYRNSERQFRLAEVNNKIMNFFCFLGQHSLVIYLLHQPVLIMMIYAI